MNLLEERSDMLLATYQPKEAMSEHQNHQYDCFRDKLGGEYPVFCFPARSADEFRFRSLLAAPCKPECLIFFDTDDYVRFDAVTWNNILTLPRDTDFYGKFESMFDDVDERFSEYVVPQSRLKEKIEVIDIKQLIEEDTFGCKSQDGEAVDVGTQMVSLNQDAARKMVRDNMPKTKNVRRNDLSAMLYQTAFIYYLGGFMWNVISDKVISVVDLFPFTWCNDSESSRMDWMRFQELRGKIFDTDNGGSHDEYLEMCDALIQSVGAERSMFLSRFKRNDPCPCGSGKKLKKCHGLKPIELFPF